LKLDLAKVAEYAKTCSPETKIYIGVDSERVLVGNVWYVDFLIAVVVHVDSKHGAKVFGGVQRERDYDKSLSKPRLRLITEVYKATEVYLELSQLVSQDISIHLDLNPDSVFGSSCVISEAIGYVKGVCGITPKVKPEAWAASIAADRIKSI
jgi:predicted RNase H-related nuclease YkuK (DUF458 family)